MCGIVVGAHLMFALWLLALSYVLFCLRFLLVRSLLSPLSPSLSPMPSGVVRALVVLFCRRWSRLPPVVLQAYLDTTELLSRTRARLLCQEAASCKSSCSLILSSLVSRLLSLVVFVFCLTSLVLSCLVAYLPYMPYRALKAFRRR